MRRLSTALLLALATAPCLADPAPLGRLFFDAEQRARLDLQRQRNPGFLPNTDDESSVTINGEVRSSNGRRTRWINGEVNWEGNTPNAPVPVGDTFNPATGERESLLRDGRIQIKRGAPAR
jgi:hypothetical protein